MFRTTLATLLAISAVALGALVVIVSDAGDSASPAKAQGESTLTTHPSVEAANTEAYLTGKPGPR